MLFSRSASGQHFDSFRERRIIPRWLLVAGLAAAAPGCDDDATSSLPSAGAGGGAASGGGGAAGAAGRAGDGGVSGEAGAGAGGGGAGGDAGNAGVDLCVKGPVELYCGSDCPSYADARRELRQLLVRVAEQIVERPCLGLDGSERLSVGADYGNTTQVFVYDADTHALVGVHFTDDTGGCSADEVDTAGRYFPGWYGEAAPDCEFLVPPACNALDAGVSAPDGSDAGDAGPAECILGD